MIKESVKDALEDVRAAFPDWDAGTVPDGQGGLWVELTGVTLGSPYIQSDTFLVFLLAFTLPASDVYPMFVRSDLTRVDSAPLGDGFQSTQLSWPGEPAPREVIQISRRTRGSFAAQTASQKVAKVLDWVRTR